MICRVNERLQPINGVNNQPSEKSTHRNGTQEQMLSGDLKRADDNHLRRGHGKLSSNGREKEIAETAGGAVKTLEFEMFGPLDPTDDPQNSAVVNPKYAGLDLSEFRSHVYTVRKSAMGHRGPHWGANVNSVNCESDMNLTNPY